MERVGTKGPVPRAARIVDGVGGAGGKRGHRQEARHQHRLLTMTYYVSLFSKEIIDGRYSRAVFNYKYADTGLTLAGTALLLPIGSNDMNGHGCCTVDFECLSLLSV